MFSSFRFTSIYTKDSITSNLQGIDCEVINAGIGGNTSADLLNRIGSDVLVLNPDLVILMVGTNDMLNSRKMISFSEYKKNLKSIVKILRRSGTKVLLISPPPADSTYLFQRHPRSAFSLPPNEKLNSISVIVGEIASHEGLYFLNLFKIFEAKKIPLHEQDEYIRNVHNSGVKDGVHPTEKGYQLIAEEVFNFLAESKLIDKSLKIVCFGDSITKGAQKNIKTSMSSHTYPNLLEENIAEYMIRNRK